MTWEELRLKLQAMADRAVATWPDFAAAVGPVHVVQDGEPDAGGGGFMFCNGRFSQGFFVDVYDGEISDESEPGGNGSLALGEMVTKPQYRAPPCQACAADRPHVALTAMVTAADVERHLVERLAVLGIPAPDMPDLHVAIDPSDSSVVNVTIVPKLQKISVVVLRRDHDV